MLPRRQSGGKRAFAAHSAQSRVSPRRLMLGVLGALFVLLFYVNARFFSSTDARSGGAARSSLATADERRAALESKLLHDHRQVRHVVFMSGCAAQDRVHAEVLAYTLRNAGYERNVSHLAYGCSAAAFAALAGRKHPRYGVATHAFPQVNEAAYVVGEGRVTTTVNPRVVQQWLAQQQQRGAGSELAHLSARDFVALVDSDAIFTKKLDVRSLFREVEDVTDPTWFGQDAAWYWPKKAPLSAAELAAALPEGSAALGLTDWRAFAAIAPFVLELGVLEAVLPTAVAAWAALALDKRHLAFPLAAAHHSVPIGISGVLSVQNYPSRYENWDFVDDVTYNPCNESALDAGARRTALPSFPISLRARNLTLPTWLDGRRWSFFAAQVPPDVLHCDAWLFQEPTGRLWHLASHTNGYERVPTILRRRHTMSVCLALQAYNRALADHKAHFCPQGFNANKKLALALGDSAWPSAVALAPDGMADASPPVYFGDYKRKKPAVATANVDTANTDANDANDTAQDDVHFVFSTTCEPYQDWQSQVLAQTFVHVQQRGRLTRILSGCSDAALAAAIRLARETPFLHLHVTPDFSAGPPVNATASDDNYAPYNKPFGLRAWLQSANPPVRESVVVVLDPDFAFLKPFVLNTGRRVTRAKDVDSEQYDAHAEIVEGLRQYKPFFVYEGTRELAQVSDHVADGVAVAQRWSSYLGAAGFDDPKSTTFQVCPDCRATTTAADGREFFAVGPPYALTRGDLGRLLDDYCNMTVATRELMHRDSWMAEMMGYAAAAARHRVRHTTFDNLALAGKDDEYWAFVDTLAENPCADSDAPYVPAEVAPLLHGCHAYTGRDADGHDWVYYKQYMPTDLFACDSWLLAVPPPSVWTEAARVRTSPSSGSNASGDDVHQRKKHAYGLCTSIKVVNQALVAFKRRVCVDGFNANRRLRLVQPRAANELQVGRVNDKWLRAADEVAPEGVAAAGGA
ncbi:hypothetical protein PybrP1_006112 [[Pythium] brassicae (nom. inval.)]|nr:hypothetical protein PybrP1_006112 [[Pythium] brassicae (nom. inval.)]